jgi:ubiquinone/menaquinone biosynthesis C-methylase UbiE
MSFYEDHILPRILNFVMGFKVIGVERQKCLTEVSGDILEVGFGSGHNMPYYTNQVKKVTAIDPSIVSAKLAQTRIQRAGFPVEYLTMKGEEIPTDSGRFDSVVSTFTLCTIPDVDAALRQIRRVLKPNGRFFFLEHGRSDDPRIQRRQDRWNATQMFLCGGCHLNRNIEGIIRKAGFEMQSLEKYYGKGPRISACLYRGIARKQGDSP